MTWALVMLIAIMIQGFVIDQHAYRLAANAHAALFTNVAYPGNRPSLAYSADQGQPLAGPDEYVPVIGYFRSFGLTREDLRIRSTRGRPDGRKWMRIGRGTGPDVLAGVQGQADPTALLSQIETGLSQIEEGKRRAQEARARGRK